jgi:hypothetical protein
MLNSYSLPLTSSLMPWRERECRLVHIENLNFPSSICFFQIVSTQSRHRYSCIHHFNDSNCLLSMHHQSVSPTPEALVGWVSETSGRGTLSLITTCLTTIFLCTWVVVHPRVYKCELYATLHKFALFFKTILAPEFIAVERLQWKGSVPDSRKETSSLSMPSISACWP